MMAVSLGTVWVRYLAIIGLSLFGGSASLSAQEARSPEAVKQTYTAIASRLDQGGDLFVVANVEGAIEQMMSDLRDIVSATAAGGDEESRMARDVVTKLHAYLKSRGFFALNGLGFSAVPREDGLTNVKLYVNRDHEAALLPLWRALVGEAPKALSSLKFMPADTELLRAGTGDIKALWQLIKEGVSEVAPPEAAAQFNGSLEGAAQVVGMPLDKLIGSVGADWAFGVQFSREATITVPMGEQMLPIPAPAMLLVMEIKDASLPDLIRSQLTAAGMPLMEAKAGETTLYSVPMPVPFVPVQLTIANHGGYFLLGTTSQVVTDAIKAYGGGGLTEQSAYTKAFAGQPERQNGVAYVSRRFGEVMREVQTKVMDMSAAQSGGDQAGLDLMRRMIERQPLYHCAMTTVNYKSGVLTSGTSSTGGREVIMGMTLAPIGILAGIAVPSFTQARGKAREAACLNNLRMIDAAKEQWALAQRKADGDPVDEAGIAEYIRGNAIPVCPQGGVYTLGKIGENPTCSLHGDALGQMQRGL